MRQTLERNAPRFLAYAVAVAGLLSVFALYLRPDFMVELAQSVWSCF